MPTADRADETIGLQAIDKDRLPSRRSVHQKGTYLQRAGVILFSLVLVVTTAVLVALFVHLFRETPPWEGVPRVGEAVDTLRLRLVSEQREAVFERFQRATERIVSATLLPVLTGIPGYIFGQHRGGVADAE